MGIAGIGVIGRCAVKIWGRFGDFWGLLYPPPRTETREEISDVHVRVPCPLVKGGFRIHYFSLLNWISLRVLVDNLPRPRHSPRRYSDLSSSPLPASCCASDMPFFFSLLPVSSLTLACAPHYRKQVAFARLPDINKVAQGFGVPPRCHQISSFVSSLQHTLVQAFSQYLS